MKPIYELEKSMHFDVQLIDSVTARFFAYDIRM